MLITVRALKGLLVKNQNMRHKCRCECVSNAPINKP